jgi:predicted regulator of Ras-like GTPase activity (Roadblock/LC7/MglB family)
LEEVMRKNFKSSNFDAFLLNESGDIIVSKLRKEGEEFCENAVVLLENCKCISGCLKEGEVEDFILHGKGGYIIAVSLRSLVLVVSGVQESEIEKTLKRVKKVAGIIEDLGLGI